MHIRLLDAHRAKPKQGSSLLGFGQVEIDPAGQNMTIEVSRSWETKGSDGKPNGKYDSEVIFSGTTPSPFRFGVRLFKGKDNKPDFLQSDLALDLETRDQIAEKLKAHFEKQK